MTVDLRIRGATIPTEARLASGDPDRLADNVAELAKSLGFMIAVGARGDEAVMNTLLEGASNLMFEMAGDYAAMGRLIAVVDNAKGKKA